MNVRADKPLPEFGTGEATNFKFGTRIDLGKSSHKSQITPKRGVVRVQGPIF